MVILNPTAHIINNLFCIPGKTVALPCDNILYLGFGYFVLTSNTFSDGCGGYLPIGSEVDFNATKGHATDTYIYLIHVQQGGNDFWLSGVSYEELLVDCACNTGENGGSTLFFDDVTDFPTAGVSNALYVVTQGTNAGIYFWNATLFLYLSNNKVAIGLACSDEVTPLATSVNVNTFRMPYKFHVSSVIGTLKTAQASGTIFTVDLKEGGVSIFSTLLTIDNTEKSSVTAATPAVISDTNLAFNSEMIVAITQIGNGTAIGLKIWIIGNVSV